MNNVFDLLWDGYIAAVGWIDRHPHMTLWFATVALVAALVFA